MTRKNHTQPHNRLTLYTSHRVNIYGTDNDLWTTWSKKTSVQRRAKKKINKIENEIICLL